MTLKKIVNVKPAVSLFKYQNDVTATSSDYYPKLNYSPGRY